MKVKGKELILKVVTILSAVLAFVGLAFKFASQSLVQMKGADAVKTNYTLNQWVDSFNQSKMFSETGVKFWQVSRVFLIISLVVLALIAIVAVLEMFISNKYLSLAKLVLSIVGIVCVIVFFSTLVVGGVKVANQISKMLEIYGGSAKLLPNVGAYFITIFGVIASVAALLDRKANN